MRGMQRTRGIFTRILGKLLILAFQGMLKKIPGYVPEDPGELYESFREILENIPGTVPEDFGKCY